MRKIHGMFSAVSERSADSAIGGYEHLRRELFGEVAGVAISGDDSDQAILLHELDQRRGSWRLYWNPLTVYG
jgi:hypothetical protein